MKLHNFRTSIAAAILAVALLCIGAMDSTPVQAQAFSGSCASIRGSFTATVTGYASPPTGAIQFRVTTNCQVVLWSTAAITGTSNAATMTVTGVPYNLWPNIGAVQLFPVIITDNSANVAGCVSVPSQAGTLTFSNSGACAGVVTSTGTKAIPAGFSVTYNLY